MKQSRKKADPIEVELEKSIVKTKEGEGDNQETGLRAKHQKVTLQTHHRELCQLPNQNHLFNHHTKPQNVNNPSNKNLQNKIPVKFNHGDEEQKGWAESSREHPKAHLRL